MPKASISTTAWARTSTAATTAANGWYKANGGGVKGGFTWPFADRFFGTVNLRVSYLSGKDTDVDLVEAKLDGSVGYMLTDNFSVAIGAGVPGNPADERSPLLR